MARLRAVVCRQLRGGWSPASIAGRLPIDYPDDDGRHVDPGEHEPDFDRVEVRADVAALVRNLPEQTQRVLELRFVHELTQSEIGRRIGASQMCVSRTLAKTLAGLRIIPTRSEKDHSRMMGSR